MKARKLIALSCLLVLVCACSVEPPLHLRRPANLEVELSATVELDVMWQVDWEALWEYHWDASVQGPLGYVQPTGMRLHTYALDESLEPVSHQSYNFAGQEGRMQVFAGYYNFLFHNNDSEAIQFTSENEMADIFAYTRVISSKGLLASDVVLTLAQKAATKADGEYDPSNDPVILQPDGLFSLFSREVWISDNLDDYEYIDGRYVYRVKGALQPSTFIYLIQMRLHNNNGRVIGSAGGAAITGMADRIDITNRRTSDNTVSVLMDASIDQASDPDLMGCRVVTFGIPGCDPYDPVSVAAAPDVPHYLVLNVSYYNGTYRNVRIDITDEVRALPTGGVIDLELDVNDFPPPEDPPQPGGSGFQALVSGWEQEEAGYTITP